VDVAAYWRRTAAEKDGAPRPSLRRGAQRRREEGAVAVVADRLVLALDERGVVLAGIGQGRGQRPAPAQERRQGKRGAQASEKPKPPSQGIPALAPRAAAASRRREPPHFSEADATANFAAALHHTGVARVGAGEDGWDAAPRRR
jgi:aspartate/methionine/tyrosine aminotransferase